MTHVFASPNGTTRLCGSSARWRMPITRLSTLYQNILLPANGEKSLELVTGSELRR